MSLQDLMKLSRNKDTKKVGLSEERIRAQLPIIKNYVAYWREYPDMFVEFLCGSNPNNLHLYFYQRVFLRACMRHRYIYATFPRGYSKSFLSVLVLMFFISWISSFYYNWRKRASSWNCERKI